MENLIKYINTHNICKVDYINQYYVNDTVKATLDKYSFTIRELVYRLKYNIPLDKVFTCKNCGKQIHFHKYNGYANICSKQCTLEHINKSQEHKDKVKQTCLKKYGVDNYRKTKEYKQKYKKTCLDKYGVDSHNKLDSCKDKARKTCLNKYGTAWYASTQHCKDQYKQTCLDKYGADNYTKTQEFQNRLIDIQEKRNATILEKYNTYYTNTDKYQEKRIKTMQQNNTCVSSKFEEDTYKLLCGKFSKNNIIRQYRSKEYPFNCDFYIKSLDLYIECNGSWTHGKYHNKCLGSFDKNNKEHINVLQQWTDKAINSEYYKNAIYTWTELDVRKLETAKKNKLNYKIFWNIKEVKEFIGV